MSLNTAFSITARRLGFLLLGASLVAVEAGAAQTGAKPATGEPATASAVKKAAPKAKAARSTRQSRARARAVARARATAAAAAEAKIPHYRVDEHGEVVPDVRAAAAIVYDPATGEVLWEENSQDQRSIASITKVMTAVVFLEHGPDLSEQVQVLRSDTRAASTTYLKTNDRVRVEDLLHLLLIPSDNAAARTLARISPLGYDGFIQRMNEKAFELGLKNTSYADTSGLDSNNISSAYDMARLIAHAAEDPLIGPIMRTSEYSFRTAARRPITVRSTNQLVRAGDVDVRGGKTGFIRSAGYCLATFLRLPEGGPSLAVVVLGATSSIGRFMEIRHLVNWLSTKAQSVRLTPALVAAPAPQ